MATLRTPSDDRRETPAEEATSFRKRALNLLGTNGGRAAFEGNCLAKLESIARRVVNEFHNMILRALADQGSDLSRSRNNTKSGHISRTAFSETIKKIVSLTNGESNGKRTRFVATQVSNGERSSIRSLASIYLSDFHGVSPWCKFTKRLFLP